MQDQTMAVNNDIARREKEPKTCLLEWMEIITQGIYPSEARLEFLFDQFEDAT